MKWIFIGLAILYFILPLDLVPDYFGLAGRIDDLLFIFFLYWKFRQYLWRENQQRKAQQRDAQTQTTSNRKESIKPVEDVEESDPYKILGVSKTSTPEEITAQYRKLIAQYHPDKVSHLGPELQQLAHKKTLAIQLAYEKLSKS